MTNNYFFTVWIPGYLEGHSLSIEASILVAKDVLTSK